LPLREVQGKGTPTRRSAARHPCGVGAVERLEREAQRHPSLLPAAQPLGIQGGEEEAGAAELEIALADAGHEGAILLGRGRGIVVGWHAQPERRRSRISSAVWKRSSGSLRRSLCEM